MLIIIKLMLAFLSKQLHKHLPINDNHEIQLVWLQDESTRIIDDINADHTDCIQASLKFDMSFPELILKYIVWQ